jgi:hypothetical protein
MRALVVAFALCGVASSAVFASDEDLARRLGARTEALVKAAQRQEHHQLLIVVREMEGSSGGVLSSTVLKTIGDLLIDQLQGEELQAFRSPLAEKLLGKRSSKQPLEPQQAADLQTDVSFDAIIAVDYHAHGDRTSVRLTLVDAERRRFTETVRLPSSSAVKTAHSPASRLGARGFPPGLALVPPLTDGPSGFFQSRAGAAVTGGSSLGGLVGGGLQGGLPDGSSQGASSGGGNVRVAGSKSGHGESQPGQGESTSGKGESKSKGEPSAASVEVGEINRRVVSFAAENLGRQVGNGECWTLAAEALKHAGAQPPDGYTFGQAIGNDQIQPGDVLQFKSARFDLPNSYILMGMPHHTAIVYSLNGDQIFVLHQNFGKRVVSILDFRLETMAQGTMQAYRPLPAR